MILVLIVAAAMSLITYVIATRWLPKHKTTLAAAAFVLVGIAPLAYIIYVGDQPRMKYRSLKKVFARLSGLRHNTSPERTRER